MRRLAAVTAASAALAAAGPAAADPGDYCVGLPDRPGCTPADSLADALAAPDRVRVFLGDVTDHAPASDGGAPVHIEGPGAELGALELASDGSTVAGVTLTGRLRLAGAAQRIRAGDGIDLLPGAADLAQAVVTGEIVASGDAQLDGVVAGTLRVVCAEVLARGLTVEQGVQASCATGPATVQLRSSLLGAADPVAVEGAATVTTAYSAHAADADATTHGRLEPADDLVDAGDPAPLEAFEPFEDVDGDPRVADGDGDGVLRRDVGADEHQPPPVPVPPGNVLSDPGAEDGGRGWTGDFVAARYGGPFLPTRRMATALGAGDAFFSAGDAPSAWLMQRIDVTASAAQIDAGRASARLGGLLGGYGADADAVTLTAGFRDPEGVELGRIVLGPVAPAVRANATTLVPRSATAALPPRTRAIDVVLRGERHGPGPEAYTDAYADQLALVLTVPGVPLEPPVQPEDPVVPDLLPFTGVVVLTARPHVDAAGRATVLLACPSGTVGGCRGSMRLQARLPGAPRRRDVARRAAFRLAPDEARQVRLRLTGAARRLLRGRRSVTARLLTVAVDDQGLRRARTVPVTLRAARRR